MTEPAENPPSDPPAPQLDVRIEQLASQREQTALVRVRTPHWLPWFVLLIGLGLFVALEVARSQAGLSQLTWEIRFSFAILLLATGFAWHLYHARSTHDAKFVFTRPEDPIAYVWCTEDFIAFGTPKVRQEQYAWFYFNKYLIDDTELRLIAGGYTLRINLTYATDQQLAQIRAGLARAFSRPRIGPALYIRHCMQCGYDLIASNGPDCPECGKPFHKYNYRTARASD